MIGDLRERTASMWDAARSSFGFLPAIAMLAGLIAGFGLPSLDAVLEVDLPVFDFTTDAGAQSLLQTVATATVSVAGLSFSVTIVAFTLASSQLSPRVLRTFRADRTTQATLALLLGTFVYCVSVLVRLGSVADGEPVPNLSITLAIVLAFASFATFAGFIAHIVRLLQPSSIIERVRHSGRQAVERPYPDKVGQAADAATARDEVARRQGSAPAQSVVAHADGYLASVRATRIVEAAAAADALVAQRVEIGDYVTAGTTLAELWRRPDADADDLADAVRDAFVIGPQRTNVQDPAFSVRQLADIALKGLSPGINDPTTAENALDALTAVLVRAASSDRPSMLRADDDGEVRFVACAPDLDDLVRLGFEQVRAFAAPYPVISRRLLTLLHGIDEAARRHGIVCVEPARQAALVARGGEGQLPTAADVDELRREHARRWGDRPRS